MRAAAEHHPGNQFRRCRGDHAPLTLVLSSIKHQPDFLLQCRFRPVIDAPRLGEDDLTMFIFPRNPIRIFWYQVANSRIKHLSQRIPIIIGDLLLIDVDELRKVVPQAQPDTQPPRGLIAFEDEGREQAGGTMLYRQGVRKTEVVFRDDIGIDRSHHTSPSGCA